MNEGVDVKA
jgi:hypothetical protein